MQKAKCTKIRIEEKHIKSDTTFLCVSTHFYKSFQIHFTLNQIEMLLIKG